nr:ubiquitin carboxyl-terminal hydrolase 15-like [Pseudochaenichthys georgianus]
MVEHSGDLRSGYYSATIRPEDDGRWYSFNDKSVTELHSQPFQSDKVEKSSSAYLLFYRKEKVSAAGTQVFRPTCETQDQSPAERRERERRTRGQQKRAKTLQPLLSSTEMKEEGLKTKPELSLEKQGDHLTSLM